MRRTVLIAVEPSSLRSRGSCRPTVGSPAVGWSVALGLASRGEAGTAESVEASARKPSLEGSVAGGTPVAHAAGADSAIVPCTAAVAASLRPEAFVAAMEAASSLSANIAGCGAANESRRDVEQGWRGAGVELPPSRRPALQLAAAFDLEVSKYRARGDTWPSTAAEVVAAGYRRCDIGKIIERA